MVSVDVMNAVSVEIKIIPANIRIKLIILPSNVLGDLSPWPTVVIVTADHQKP